MKIKATRRRPKGTGGITQRQDGTFQGTVPYTDSLDHRKVKTLYGRTKREVEEKMRDFRAGGCQAPRPDSRTLKQLCDHLLGSEDTPSALVRSGQVLESTASDYRMKFKLHVIPLIGHIPLSKLTAAHLDEVLLKLTDCGKKRTALHVRNTARMLFTEASRLAWMDSNPADSAVKVQVKSKKRLIYNLDQLRATVAAAESQRVRVWILLAGVCALRESEIAGLVWPALEGGNLTIERQRDRDTTKSASGTRVIPLPGAILGEIGKLAKESVFMFPASKRGRKGAAIGAVHQSTIYHLIMRAIAKAGTPKITVHDLRHSANNILKQLGVDAATRRDILGHSSTVTTNNVYSQTVDAEMIDAMTLIGNAFEGSPKEETKRA